LSKSKTVGAGLFDLVDPDQRPSGRLFDRVSISMKNREPEAGAHRAVIDLHPVQGSLTAAAEDQEPEQQWKSIPPER